MHRQTASPRLQKMKMRVARPSRRYYGADVSRAMLIRARCARMAPAAYGAKDASAVTSKMPDRGAIPDLSGAQHLQRRATKVAHSRTHAPAQAHRFAQIDFKSRHAHSRRSTLWFYNCLFTHKENRKVVGICRQPPKGRTSPASAARSTTTPL